MKNIKIWHEYNRLEYPGRNRTIFWIDDENNCCVCRPDKEDWAVGCYDFIKEWAYTKELTATSKALDVAIGRLEELTECPYQGGVQSVKLGVKVTAATGLTEIGLIMKGNK